MTEDTSPKPLLGKALIEEGILTEAQLDRALRIQKYLEQPRQLGQILVELGYVSKQTIADMVKKHGVSMRLGDMLVSQGLIEADTLEEALRLGKERGIRVGEALIELGAINQRSLLQNLAHQAGVPYIEPAFNMIEPSVLSGIAPDYLARNRFVPFSKSESGTVTVVVSDIEDETVARSVAEVFRDYALALGPADVIQQAIDEYRRFRQQRDRQAGRIEVEDDSVVNLVNQILISAIEDRASDVHIEPLSDVVRLRNRIDGVLVYKTDFPKDLLPRLISRLKILAEADIGEHQKHTGGHFTFEHKGREFDLRLSIYVSAQGESAVLRLLSKQTGLVQLDELGMNPRMQERYRAEVLDLPTGVVLVTGPTGSGKTTTLYSSLTYCMSNSVKIITVEDPVEYMIDGIVQCSTNVKAGRTFESSLREMVRQDPDIIVLGEIRDRTTAEVAIQAALTGHKVYSTFHTEDTIGGLLRLMDMDIETFLISSTVISVVAQRLLRRICPECSVPYTPSAQEMKRVYLDPREVREFELHKGAGCKHCNYTGYFGRLGIYELLVVNQQVKEAILEKKSSHAIRQACTESTGLISMWEDGITKTIRGATTFEEVLRCAPRPFGMRPLRQILAMTQ